MEGDLQRNVGRNLRAYRRTRGLSQEKFAEVLGVHRTYMGGIERGERNLTLRSVERIARCIELEPSALLQPTQAGRQASSSKPDFAAGIRNPSLPTGDP